jgi:hypothetical protein
MAYEDIAIPTPLSNISAGMFGTKVRDAILDLDKRVAAIESTSANYVFKNTDTTRTTAGLTADPDLYLPLEANSQYFIELYLRVSGANANRFNSTWGGPSGTVGYRRVLGPGSAIALSADANGILLRDGDHGFVVAVGYALPRNVVGDAVNIQEIAVVNTASVAGDMNFNWGQISAGSPGTVVHKDSFMRATKAAG